MFGNNFSFVGEIRLFYFFFFLVKNTIFGTFTPRGLWHYNGNCELPAQDFIYLKACGQFMTLADALTHRVASETRCRGRKATKITSYQNRPQPQEKNDGPQNHQTLKRLCLSHFP
jgi:hypothetical protein